jgi:hypothetical protein
MGFLPVILMGVYRCSAISLAKLKLTTVDKPTHVWGSGPRRDQDKDTLQQSGAQKKRDARAQAQGKTRQDKTGQRQMVQKQRQIQDKTSNTRRHGTTRDTTQQERREGNLFFFLLDFQQPATWVPPKAMRQCQRQT